MQTPVPLPSEMQPEPEPDDEDHPFPGPRARRTSPNENGVPPAAPEATLFRSCLDRPYVQKEIGWACKYSKKIIVIYEKDERRAGFFDFAKAWEKYGGTDWEFILNIHAEPYQRDEDYAEGMVTKIMKKASGNAGSSPAAEPLNDPGSWDCFLSHAQATGGDQAQTTQLRLKAKGWAVWYDNAMLDRSTAAMEEGVKHSRCFVLFLTGDRCPEAITPTPSDAPVPYEMTCSLMWNNTDDLQLHCMTPSGFHLYVQDKRGAGGVMDVEMNSDDANLTTRPVENICFGEGAGAVVGKYKFWVRNNKSRNPGPTRFQVRLRCGDDTETKQLMHRGSDITAFEFEILP